MESSNSLDKLLPKSISAKHRRRRRNHQASGTETSALDGADTADGRSGIGHDLMGDGDNGRLAGFPGIDAMNERGDEAPYEASLGGPEPSDLMRRSAPASGASTASPTVLPSQASLIGYLSASSPVIQTKRFDSRSRSDRSGSSRASSPTASIKGRQAASAPARPNTPPVAKPASAARPLKTPPRIETAPTAESPSSADKQAPLIVSTPPTPVEQASRVFTTPPARHTGREAVGIRPGTDGSPPHIVHRRSKSGSVTVGPSKLSSSILAPPTPIAESGEEGSTNSTGFFSSVLSAAQNAATTFSKNIPVTGIALGNNKARPGFPKAHDSSSSSPYHLAADDGLHAEPAADSELGADMDQKESAVRTLGSGELSLSQLGITDTVGTMTSPTKSRFPDMADTRMRSESAPADPQPRLMDLFSDDASSRPHSLLEAAGGDPTSPTNEGADGNKASVQRSGSVRSAMKPRRKRRSSATTGGTVISSGTVVAAANSSAAQAGAGYGAPKLTGFAIASKKRNRDFHNLFKSVPDDDYLIEDYSCALQREILAHGRLYVSEGHLCFSSNILGWTTTLVISFDEIVSVEKRSTALVFKNGLMISTLHAKHVFASFTSRDATYDLIVNIWKLGHPTLRSTLNGVRLEGTGGDKTVKVDNDPQAGCSGSDDDSGGEEDEYADDDYDEDGDDDRDGDEDDDDDDDEFYDEEAHGEVNALSATDAGGAEDETEKPGLRKISATAPANSAAADGGKDVSSSVGMPGDFPGPATHAPTDCGDSSSHYEKVVGDEYIPAPLGHVYNLLFGPASGTWMLKWLAGEQKCSEVQMEDKRGLGADNKVRNFSYIKPLNAPIGPKQTKCIVTETLDGFDLEKAVNVSVSTQNPDVPSGNIFTVKTKYCLSWAENNGTRMQANCTVEWSGKTWLKGPIEKGVVDGQTQHCKDLFAALKATVTSRSRSGTAVMGAGRTRKKGKKHRVLQSADGTADGKGGPGHRALQHWGPLEPVRGFVEPLMGMVRPVLTGNIMYGLLVGLLVAMWFGFGSMPGKGGAPYGPEVVIYRPHRLVAYDELWRREESELWEWLEERVGLDRLGGSDGWQRSRLAPRRPSMEEKLREDRMRRREVEEAIRVTEEKLRVLREAVAKRSEEGEQSSDGGGGGREMGG